MRISAFIFILGLVVLTGGISYALYDQHVTQTKLHLQLQQLDEVLTDNNDRAKHAAEGTFKGLRAEVIKNQNQPHDRALLTRAEAFAARADSLVRTLRTRREKLLRATGNHPDTPLSHPNATGAVATELAAGTPAHENLAQQLANYVRACQQLCPRDTVQLVALKFDNMPVVAALAHLTKLESDVRAAEIATLQQLAPALGARRLSGHIVAVATAESNTVVPGTVYRAQLYLTRVMQPIRVSMTCNGQPVRVGSDGQGIVRFVAHRRPGPATWLGTIHLNQNGRDSTFEVRVPYRVVRR